MPSSTSSFAKRCGLVLVAATLLLMLVAGPALAHRLPGRVVRSAVADHAAREVPKGTFIRAVVECSRFSVHRFICGVGYETLGTHGKPRVACRELITAFVRNHGDKLRLQTNALCRPTSTPSRPAPLPPNTPVPIQSSTNSTQCTSPGQFGNTGNVGPANAPPAPDNLPACETTVQQSSAASS